MKSVYHLGNTLCSVCLFVFLSLEISKPIFQCRLLTETKFLFGEVKIFNCKMREVHLYVTFNK